MKLVFMGSPEFAVASLNAIADSNHDVLLVITQPDKPANRGQKMTPCPVAEFAAQKKLSILQPQTLKNNDDVANKIRTLRPDVIVVVAYGKILPKEILDIPTKGCINLHASLLPKYRGAAPINWAIINGDEKTGVTTMFMNEKMDEGDILLQCATEIIPHDTAEALHDHLAVLGAELLVKTLDKIEEGELKGIPQDHSKATYGRKLTKEDGLIDWKASAVGICNRVRGLLPWPRAYTRISDSDILFIFDTAPIESDCKMMPGTVTSLDRGIIVTTGLGELCILEIQSAGKKRMPAVEFLKGRPLKIGDKFI